LLLGKDEQMKSNCRVKQSVTILLLLSLVFIWGCAGSPDSRSIAQKVRNNVHASGIKEILQETGNTDKRYLVPIYTALREKQYNKAITLAKKLQSVHPDDENLYYIQGIAYLEQNDLMTALRYFEKTSSINNNRGDAYYYQSLISHKLNKDNRALSSINTAIHNEQTAFQLMNQEKLRYAGKWTVEGRRAHLFFLRAAINSSLHKTDDAFSDVNRAISLSPYKSAEHFKLRGNIYFYEKSELSLAYSDFQQAAELAPNDGDVWELLGSIDTYMGHYDQAIIELNKAVILAPDRLNEALGYAAVAYWLKGDRNSALDAMGKAIRKKPDYNMYYHLGYFHHLLGNPSQARANFKKAEQLQPKILNLGPWLLTKVLPRNSPAYPFYEHEYATAKKYLGTGNAVADNGSQTRTPTLKITSLNLDPDPVRVNRAFDIKISFMPDIPGAGKKQLPIIFYFKIYKNQKKLFTSKNISIETVNGRKKSWINHMDPVHKAGTYKIVTFVKYKEIVDQKSIPLVIE